MKALDKKTEQAVLTAYHSFFDAFFSGSVAGMAPWMHEDIQIIGTTEAEIYRGKQTAITILSEILKQVHGNMEFRNRDIQVKGLGHIALVEEFNDLYVKNEAQWVFYAKSRSTCLLERGKDRWLLSYQHSSFPDTSAETGETIGLARIQKENTELREAVRRHTAELELKNRELEIEAALERIRAASMAMHHSSEFSGVALVLVKQLEALGIAEIGSSINIVDEGKKSYISYSADTRISDGEKVVRVNPEIGLDSTWIAREAYKRRKNGEDNFTIAAEGKHLEEFVRHTMDQIGEDLGRNVAMDRLYFQFASFDHFSSIVCISLEPFSADSQAVIKRMATTFGMSYRRFLDLQKAEAQAREAQIEAALERVRSRTMAMHRTDELNEVVGGIFEELNKMGFDASLCSIGIYDKESKGADWWSFIEGKELPGSYHFPYLESRWFKEVYDAWSQKKPYHYIELYGKEREEQDRLSFEKTDWKNLPEDVKNALQEISADAIKATYISMKCGMLEIVSDNPLTDDQIKLLQRFTKVIDLTYTRVDDLQKAEAQAREAQIEAALERLRGATMAMHQSDELRSIIVTLFAQLQQLGLEISACSLILFDEKDHSFTEWMAGFGEEIYPEYYHVPFFDHPYYNAQLKCWKEGKKFDTILFEGALKKSYDRTILSVSDYKNLPASAIKGILETDFAVVSGAYMKYGMIECVGREPVSDEQAEILQRFAKVFEQTYTRFLDLQRAEAQALKIREEKSRLEKALTELQATQSQLIQQEKLASLGQLTAGIAHEIKNPLNFVNNFSEVSQELLAEMQEEIDREDWAEVKTIATDLRQNLAKIYEHGHRADGIVQSMLLHARGGSGEPEPTDLNAFVREYVNLAYHGMRAGKEPINVTIDLDLDEQIGKVPLIAEDFSRVILNLCNNAFDAMRDKLKAAKENAYQPKLTVRTHRTEEGISIEVADNGPGIPEAIRDKILQPFFTTKKGTAGTGLGLSISNDIVKAQGGTIKVSSKTGEGTSFILLLK